MSGDDSLRIMELSLQGFVCSQILNIMALEAQGKENPELVRAMAGLQAGMGKGKVCGALTGGCCVLGLYAGKGSAEQTADSSLFPMLNSLVEWFEEQYQPAYGGIDCAQILEGDSRNMMARCPQIISDTFAKVKEILEENHIDLSGVSDY